MTRRPVLVSVISGLAAILILAAGCSEQNPTAVQLDPITVSAASVPAVKANVVAAAQPYAPGVFSAIIGSEGGELNFGVGSIHFPAGAVSRPTRITAKVDGVNIAAEFGPHGTVFPANAQPTLTLKYAGVIVDESRLQIQYLDKAGNVLESFVTITDIGAKTAIARVPHFSKMALATN